MPNFGTTGNLKTSPIQKIVRKSFLIMFIIFSFLLVFIGKPEGAIIKKTSGVVLNVVAPAVEVLAFPVNKIRGFFAAMRRFFKVDDENSRLADENSMLRQQLLEANTNLADIQSAAATAGYGARIAYHPIAAQVVGGGGSGYSRSYILNSGMTEGVRKYQPVAVDGSLAGQIVAVGAHYSRILLLTDSASKISVKNQRTGQRSFLFGNGGKYPRLAHFETMDASQIGDVVATSGLDENVPAGIPVGIIGAMDDDEGVIVQPFVNPYTISFAAILRSQKPSGIAQFLAEEAE